VSRGGARLRCGAWAEFALLDSVGGIVYRVCGRHADVLRGQVFETRLKALTDTRVGHACEAGVGGRPSEAQQALRQAKAEKALHARSEVTKPAPEPVSEVRENPLTTIAKATPTDLEEAAAFLRKHARAETKTADEYRGTDAEMFHRTRGQAMRDAAAWVEHRMWVEDRGLSQTELVALYERRQARAERMADGT
jgi:hypothetical protein